MTTFIKAKLEKSDDETLTNMYRVAANIRQIYFAKYHHSKIHDDEAINYFM